MLCWVNLPDPARYALHKVLIAGEREGAFRVKTRKDLAQAAHLLAVLSQWRPESLTEALDDLLSRGPGWQSRFQRGAQPLKLEGWPRLEAAPMLVERSRTFTGCPPTRTPTEPRARSCRRASRLSARKQSTAVKRKRCT